MTFILVLMWCLPGLCRLMLAAMVVLIMIAVTNYGALFFACYATDYYGMWLKTYHRRDLACLRILVGHLFVYVCMCGESTNHSVMLSSLGRKSGERKKKNHGLFILGQNLESESIISSIYIIYIYH